MDSMSWNAREGVVRWAKPPTPRSEPPAPDPTETYLTLAQANGKAVARSIHANVSSWVLGGVVALIAFFGGGLVTEAIAPDAGFVGGIVPAALVLTLTWIVATGLKWADAMLRLTVAMSYDLERAGHHGS